MKEWFEPLKDWNLLTGEIGAYKILSSHWLVQFFSMKKSTKGPRLPYTLKLRESAREISEHKAGIFKKSMGARHRGGIGFSYRPAMGLHRLAEFIPWHQFRGPINI
jgi:hypothetical protein